MKRFLSGLLPRVAAAIALGILCGNLLPEWCVRMFVTFNEVFGQLLGFAIPLIIAGLVTPAIADIGRGAGRMLALTAAMMPRLMRRRWNFWRSFQAAMQDTR